MWNFSGQRIEAFSVFKELQRTYGEKSLCKLGNQMCAVRKVLTFYMLKPHLFPQIRFIQVEKEEQIPTDFFHCSCARETKGSVMIGWSWLVIRGAEVGTAPEEGVFILTL